jgi:F-type H+-transporting ATPase subunit b
MSLASPPALSAGPLAAASHHAAASSTTSDFLIPNGTFIVELIIFLIVLGVVAKWILPPIQAVVGERHERIRAAVHAADEAREMRKGVLAERDRLLGEARSQARSHMDGAMEAGERAREAARARGQEEYGRLMTASRESLEHERARVRFELVRNLETLVVAAAERVLGTQIDASRHRQLIEEAVAAAAGGGE